jgi:ATP-dependent DNA ligase
LIYADHLEAKGKALPEFVCERDLEGIVAKRGNGPYSISERWVKIRNREYSQMRGRHELFDAFRKPRPSVVAAKARKRSA